MSSFRTSSFVVPSSSSLTASSEKNSRSSIAFLWSSSIEAAARGAAPQNVRSYADGGDSVSTRSLVGP